MSYYSNRPISSEELSRQNGSKVVGYGAGQSHEGIIQRAGGEIGYDGFRDPRPNEQGGMVANRVYIDEKTNSIRGIDFSKNGQFCCSYTGRDYEDIRDSNQRDCEEKKNMSRGGESQTDEYGVDISKSSVKSSENNHSNDRGR